MSDLMQKLATAKKIMDIHNSTPRNNVSSTPVNENYNINQPELVVENQPKILNSVIMNQEMSVDAIRNSKLPDEIKRLMMENPIAKPELNGPVLSDELIKGVTRLMGTQQPEKQKTVNENISNTESLREMLKDVVREVLMENGVISESSQKTNESISIRVGKHVFEGKISKVKKLGS